MGCYLFSQKKSIVNVRLGSKYPCESRELCFTVNHLRVAYFENHSAIFISRINENIDKAIPLSANPTKWSNTLKQFVGNLPTNYLRVFDHFVILALKGLLVKLSKYLPVDKSCLELFRNWYQENCLKWTWRMYFKINENLIQDFHSHLSVTEVTGYLCGTWDSSRQRKFYSTY